MNITKNDVFYMLMSIVVAAIGVVAVGNQNTNIGLYGLMGLLGIAVVMAIIIRPSLGANILVIAIFTNISDQLSRHGFPGIIKPLVAIVAVALLIRYTYAGQMPIWNLKTIRAEIFLFSYFMIVTASFLVASDQDTALTAILDLGKDIIIIYCILFALRQPAVWKQTMWLIMITTTALCLLSTYQVITGNYDENFFGLASVTTSRISGDSTTSRTGGPINAPNVWGQILVAVSVLIVFRIINEASKLTKVFCVFMLAVILYAILNTYSRAAYIVLAIDVALIMFLFEKRFNPLIAVAGVGILILLIPFLPAGYRERFTTLTLFTSETGIYQDSSFRGRTSEMLTGLAMFTSHPILGVGTANYPMNYQRYAQLIGIEFRAEARDPHSLYVQLLAETGILGAVTFLGMVFFLIVGLNKACKAIEQSHRHPDWLPWVNAIRLAIISYLLTSVFLHNAYIRYFWILVAMALAAIQITHQLLNTSEKTTSIEVRR